MKIFRFFILTLLSISLSAAGAQAQAKKKKAIKKTRATAAKKTAKPVVNPPAVPVVEPRREDYKIIAEGMNAKTEEPFLFVARDAKTYALLQALVENLPDASGVDFTREAVVAAFAGTKPTAGWEVLIRRLSDKILIDLNEPRKDMMHAQMLTAPYKIALVPVEEEKALPPVEATPTWTNKTSVYRVSKGSFIYSGGFAFRERTFGAEGTIAVLTRGDLITVMFNLTAKGDKAMTLAETASGSLKDGKIDLARLDAGAFSENPKPPVNVSGTISDTKLSLRFEPNPTNVADGFEARGTVEAVKVK
ncbi:MAG TPA: protease complex subunit PrcB family protein [Pyrinomonadaceae bacterium]|nr:protease complex subunit PrcB family protein [Pyrinomonadaceae bacterium]